MATVDRVLPWRRHLPAPVEELAPLIKSFHRRYPKAPTSLITSAYEVASRAHRHQSRSSGEAYINHPIAVAQIVADIGLDDVSLAAALLHDSVEDSELTVSQVETSFGKEVAAIVDGVTKLERLHFDSKEAAQAASMRKLMVAMSKDLRVLLIKLADRLHNMRTIGGVPPEKQVRIAQETLDIYAPLAHRLGIDEIKQQLEDLAFAALYPKRFAELDHLVYTRTPERDQYMALTLNEVTQRLKTAGIEAEVTGRGKHLWSIYEKMVQKGRPFDEIFDLNAVRIITSSAKDCYAALGCIHAAWTPVQGRFKDYIAVPKFNLYQSLHTTVIGPQNKALEVQVRTLEMHQRAEKGVAAHWSYKGHETADISWLNRIVDWQAETEDPAAFMETLKTDLQHDEIFVFTPKGRVISLPAGSTPVDFAYAVHTAVGHSCIGAKVNGKLFELEAVLRSGDTCEIIRTEHEPAPKEAWLSFVASPRARNKIKQWLSRERRGEDTAHVEDGDDEDEADGPLEELPTARTTRERRNVGVHADGLPDMPMRLSRCCTPVPGDPIVGFVTRGRGISVHRSDCSNANELLEGQAQRIVDVEWDDTAAEATFRAAVEVVALDRTHLLRDVANALSDQHVNIVACSTHTGSDRVAKMRFDFEMRDASHLEAVLRSIVGISSVYDAYRLVPA